MYRRKVAVWKDGIFLFECDSVKETSLKLGVTTGPINGSLKFGHVVKQHYQITGDKDTPPSKSRYEHRKIKGRVYCLYEDDKIVDRGTASELADRYFVSPETIRNDFHTGYMLEGKYKIISEESE